MNGAQAPNGPKAAAEKQRKIDILFKGNYALKSACIWQGDDDQRDGRSSGKVEGTNAAQNMELEQGPRVCVRAVIPPSIP